MVLAQTEIPVGFIPFPLLLHVHRAVQVSSLWFRGTYKCLGLLMRWRVLCVCVRVCVCPCVCVEGHTQECPDTPFPGPPHRSCPFLSHSGDPPRLNLLPMSPVLVAMLSSHSPFSRPCHIWAFHWERKERLCKLHESKNLPGVPSVLSPFAFVSALVYADWVCL